MREINTTSSSDVIQSLLHDLSWLKDGEQVLSLASAGEGNMNVVLRVRTNQRSIILKQSRPYVQKYQDIPAPIERIQTEREFYTALDGGSISWAFPKILNYKPEHFLLMMEDLGDVEDMTSIYASREVSKENVRQLVDTLNGIHRSQVSSSYPLNMALRALNHQHIFVLPYAFDNGFDLDDIQAGLSGLSASFKEDEELKSKIKELGSLYLSKGDTLLHGDYYPGSWMLKGNEVKVLDPEFSFVGPREFDLGVFLAHMLMATMNETFVETIKKDSVSEETMTLTNQYMGAEIIRRLIGLAQLPLERSLEEKAWLLEKSRALLG